MGPIKGPFVGSGLVEFRPCGSGPGSRYEGGRGEGHNEQKANLKSLVFLRMAFLLP